MHNHKWYKHGNGRTPSGFECLNLGGKKLKKLNKGATNIATRKKTSPTRDLQNFMISVKMMKMPW